MKASDVFVKALENEGVHYIFGIPGEENLDFINSVKNSSIQFIATRHEQGAGFMAATYGRLTGKAGVCLATLGPGATNLVTPAAYAQLGGMPMVMITGQKPLFNNLQGQFQRIDVVNLMHPVTKLAQQISIAENISAVVSESFRFAQAERPGAVHIELPEDVAAKDIPDRIFESRTPNYPSANQEDILSAIEMIKKAKMPLLLFGAGANRKSTCSALKDFVDKTGIYFFNTQMGKGVVDERHELFLGTAALSSNDFLHSAIEKADLIINVGHDVIEKPPFIMKHNGTKVIHINYSPAQIDSVYFPQLNVVGDITETIQRITKSIETSTENNFSFYKSMKQKIDGHLTKYFEDKRFPTLPQRLVTLLRTALPDDGIISLDNGIYKIWFARNYKAYQRNTLLLDNALATMGAGLSAAIMSKLLYPERKVVAVLGDGGFMMNSQELETAIRLKIDLTVIILNDGSFGMIKWKQQDMGFENYAMDYGNPDFVAYAESYGAIGHRPSTDAEVIEMLDESLNGKGINVIDLAVDYSLNHPILNVLLKESKIE